MKGMFLLDQYSPCDRVGEELLYGWLIRDFEFGGALDPRIYAPQRHLDLEVE